MGIPSFVRWLIDRHNGVLAKWNNKKVDNLYIDANGVIHPCSRINSQGKYPETEEDKIHSILEYFDFLIPLVKPSKLLFIAIDGVAPRAKLNQQRSRRFARVHEVEIDAQVEEKVRQKCDLFEDLASKPSWDTNVITPGTPFMAKLTDAIQKHVIKRVNEHPDWQHLKVIFSDASIPGEGEHKIFSYIKRVRSDPQYNKKTVHVVHGLDADLVMLSLQTHEQNIYLIREDNQARFDDVPVIKKPHMILNLAIVKLILDEAFAETVGALKFKLNIERVVDDFVFLSSLAGNDFVPRLPTLKIDDGALDVLLANYQRLLVETGDYITCGPDINFPQLIQLLSYVTDEKKSFVSQMHHAVQDEHYKLIQNSNMPSPKKVFKKTVQEMPEEKRQQYFKTLQKKEKFANFGDASPKTLAVDIEKSPENDWTFSYYQLKLKIAEEDVRQVRNDMVREYLKILAFVWKYYSEFLPSWTHFYPFHYAPFAVDIVQCWNDQSSKVEEDVTKFNFNISDPFTPLAQLMAVLPRSSSHCLPDAYKELMNSKEFDSFYPDHFEKDLNTAKADWKAIHLLPFIDDVKLTTALSALESTLTEEEKLRNSFGCELLFFNKTHSSNTDLLKIYDKISNKTPIESTYKLEKVDADHFFRCNGNTICGHMYKLADVPRFHVLPKMLDRFSTLDGEVTTNKSVHVTALVHPTFNLVMDHLKHAKRAKPKSTKFGAAPTKVVAEKVETKEEKKEKVETKVDDDDEATTTTSKKKESGEPRQFVKAKSQSTKRAEATTTATTTSIPKKHIVFNKKPTSTEAATTTKAAPKEEAKEDNDEKVISKKDKKRKREKETAPKGGDKKRQKTKF